ncbi:MAG: DUF2088 domain-containing protein [Chitinispirillaceae bacterium]|nr:DUF2088 domain-containing protein [Chitinispirillaceae bacterium]
MAGILLSTVKQRFPAERNDRIEAGIRQGLHSCMPVAHGGGRIAIAVGSRGITDIDVMVKAAAEAIRSKGAQPIIVPAMGSHGNATPEGQSAILAGYGITQEQIGAPVVSSMEVAEIGASRLGNRVFMDRAAFESDGVVLINRIKPHTDFHGSFESGLVKMGVIGLGKHAAALELHSYGVSGLRDHVPSSFETVAATGKILAGIAVVENAYDEIAVVEVIPGGNIMKREPDLLDLARSNMPSLPVEEIDVLIVDWLGKNISGTGMDPNIIGRMRIRGQEEPRSPRIKNIVVTDLTPESHGNALGIGLADIITRRLFDRIDFEPMRVNVRASLFLERIKVPFIAATAAEAVSLALRACGRIEAGKERVVRIRDTLHLGTIQVSGAVLDEIRDRVEIVRGPETIFNEMNELREL